MTTTNAPGGASSEHKPVREAPRKLAGSNVDCRTVLHFRIDMASVAPLLPRGWEVAPPDTGAAAGATMRVTLIETIAAYDAHGRGREAVTYMHIGIPARHRSAPSQGLMLITGLSPGGAGPYGTNLQAVVSLERTLVKSTGCTVCAEGWALRAPDVAGLSVKLSFLRGHLEREKAEAFVYSGVKPSFHRVYVYDQYADTVCTPGDRSRLRTFELKATGRPFEQLFDGGEELLSVVSVPVYTREVFLPASE
jgi:hypothetical protein